MKQNKAEKLLAGVLSISLAMGVSVMPAFAAQVQGPPYEDMSRVYLTKNYELANTVRSPRKRPLRLRSSRVP